MDFTEAAIEEMAQALYVYDVEQGAWENDQLGFEINAQHVLTHLAKGLATKDFNHGHTVFREIAPDSIQYALRLARWSDVDPTELAERQSAGAYYTRSYNQGFPIPSHQVLYIEAMAELAANLHDLGHASSRDAAIESRGSSMRLVGGLLLGSVRHQVTDYQFNPRHAFDRRLATLRERFGIPLPNDPVA